MAAKKAGCDVITDVVKRITPIGSCGYEIEAERSGQRIRGKKVLLATGSFTESRNLLPMNLQPLVTPSSVTVLLVNFTNFCTILFSSPALNSIRQQWQIQDFPEVGAPTLRGSPTYDFAKVSQKLHEIERI